MEVQILAVFLEEFLDEQPDGDGTAPTGTAVDIPVVGFDIVVDEPDDGVSLFVGNAVGCSVLCLLDGASDVVKVDVQDVAVVLLEPVIVGLVLVTLKVVVLDVRRTADRYDRLVGHWRMGVAQLEVSHPLVELLVGKYVNAH